MDLPPCPVCGAALEHPTPRARATCPACGFSTPVELDTDALRALLREAAPSPRGLEASFPPRSAAADGARDGQAGAPHARPGVAHPPTASPGTTARARAAPAMAPPPRPGHIDARMPPAPEDPRAPLEAGPGAGFRGAPTATARASEDARRRRDLAARGELLK